LPPESRVHPMHEVTRILSVIEQGNPQGAEHLLPLVYDELRRLAAEKMREEKAGQTLQATALVHEAYVRLVDVEKAQHWESRRHFFAAAAEAMRRILVETARRKQRVKHGGEFRRLAASEPAAADPDGGGEEGAEETYFAYDGGQVLLRFDGSETGDLVDRYMWGPAVDYLLSDEQLTSPTTPGTVYWALTDHLNTVRDLALYDFGTDTTSVANHRVYDAYGNLTGETNAAVDCLFGYTGRQFDEATGLQNNLNRWYDPRVGRWLSEDPIGYAGADANLYRYVRNSLTNAVDPLGLASPRETPRPLVLLIQQYGGRIPRANWEGFCRDQKIGLTTEQSIQLNRGCTGFCAIAQADNPRKGPYEVFPENREGTICYRTEREARNRTCEAKKGEQNFVFAKTGEWKRGEPEKGREGPIPNDSVVGKRSGELNESMRQWLDELEDTYGWRPYPQTGYYNYWTYAYGVYFSMDQASKYGDQYVIIKYAPPEVKGTAIMWCSTCRRPR